MEKSLTYASLADLLQNYIACYMRWWHTVLRIRIGLPVPHDVMHDGQVIALSWLTAKCDISICMVCCCENLTLHDGRCCCMSTSDTAIVPQHQHATLATQ